MKRQPKIPSAVLAKARAAVEQTSTKKPVLPPLPRTRQAQTREKVIVALKKLHPMD